MDFSFFSTPYDARYGRFLCAISKAIFLKYVSEVSLDGVSESTELQFQAVKEILLNEQLYNYWNESLASLVFEVRDSGNELKVLKLLLCCLDANLITTLTIPNRYVERLFVPSHMTIKVDVTDKASSVINLDPIGEIVHQCKKRAVRLGGDSWCDSHNIEMEKAVTDIKAYGPTITAYIQYLAEHAPTYWQWVNASVRKIIPIERPGLQIKSSTCTKEFGSIRVGFPLKNWEFCEAAVHEASHQYINQFMLLKKPFVDNDMKLYSPFSKMVRNIEYSFYGYHALGNAILMYTEMNILEDKEISARLNYLSDIVRGYSENLFKEGVLTPEGLAILNPLKARLAVILPKNS